MSSSEAIDDYLQGLTAVRAAFLDMSLEQLSARPIAGKWSAKEVLCHLVDMDVMAVSRIRLALFRNEPHIPGVSPEEMTSILAVEARDAGEEVGLLEALRTEMARILRSVPEEKLERCVVIHKSNGDLVKRSVLDLLRGITEHVVHHLAFVEAKRQALGLASMQPPTCSVH